MIYIRFGDVPDGEKSGIYKGEELVGFEDGVSVYNAMIDGDGKIHVCLSLPFTRTTLDTFQMLIRYDNRPCFLVKGEYVGRGTDNEPLIRNVSIIKRIEYRKK